MSPNVPVFGGSIYKALVDAASDAIVVVNQKGLIVLINGQTEGLFGYSRMEMLGQPVEMLLPERYRASHHGLRGAFLHAPKTRPMGPGLDLFARRKDGAEIPVDIALHPIESEAGLLVCAAIRDVTRRKRNEDRLRILLDSAPDAMVVTNQEGKIVLMNPQVEKVFGHRRKGLLEHPVQMLLREDCRGEYERLHQGCVREAEIKPTPVSTLLHGRKKDGTEVPLEIVMSPHQAREGVLVCVSLREATGSLGTSRSSKAALGRARGTVLLVEEQLLPREWAAEFLRQQGYLVLPAPDGETALAFAENHSGAIDLLVSEVVLPSISGTGLAERLRKAHPRMRVLFATGHSSEGATALRDHRVLQKPFSLNALASKVRSMLEDETALEQQSSAPPLLTAPLSAK